ncbi:MAG: glycosyltransferase family 4 protein [Candidatus Woesearchaeota archaeon]
MLRKKVLRVCHKFLTSDDGYDLDIQDLCKSTSDCFINYVFTYIDISTKEYVRKKNLLKRGDYYYHKKLRTYIIPIEYKKRYHVYLKDFYLWYNIKLFSEEYKKIFNKIEPDIVHIHGTLLPQFIYAAILARNKCKVIASHHIGLINTNYRKQKFHILILKYIMHNIFPLCSDKLLCVSNYGKKSFNFFKSNIDVINPVPNIPKNNPSNFKRIFDKNVLCNKFQIDGDDKLFCCVGRISRQKNQLNQIKAFNNIISKNPKYKLIIVRDSADDSYYNLITEELRKYLNNYCLIKGADHAEVLKVIEYSDYLLSVTLNEGLSRVAMEGQALGKPVIASKDSGYEDFINDGGNGLLVDPDNVEEIKRAIININKIKNSVKHSHRVYIDKMIKIYEGG